jgi:hypothetical protein
MNICSFLGSQGRVKRLKNSKRVWLDKMKRGWIEHLIEKDKIDNNRKL